MSAYRNHGDPDELIIGNAPNLSDAALWDTVDRTIVSLERRISQYAVAVATTACAALANAALWPELGSRYPLIAFFPAVAVSSSFGGFWPGIVSTTLSAIATGYLWFAPRFFNRPSHQGDVVILTMFVAISLTIVSLHETLRRRTERAEQAEREAVRLADELQMSQGRLLEAERVARRQAEQANRLKDEFLSFVSHELRTPLSAILGWTDILRQGAASDERRDRALQAISRNGQQQAQLLAELLDAARINSGTLRLEHRGVDLGAVVREAWEIVVPAAEAKSIQASIDVDSAVSTISFYGDAARLRQVMSNLFSNAVKFTPTGGKVSAEVRQCPGAIEITVSDTGRGIADEFLPFVFEPFRQADESQAHPQAGFGLGLSIAKHLVEAHGGEVRVTSDGENQGTRFTVRLPLAARAINHVALSRASA